MLKKLIFFFAWIGIFLISLVALNYILLPGQIVYDNPFVEAITSFQYKMIILVIAALYLFICLIKFFSLFERKKDYERKTENGLLKISKTTINNYVMDLLRKDPDITGIKTVSELKGNKFFINIKCELLAKMNIANKISYLQNLIKTDLMENLGVDVNKVVVNIAKIEAREKEKTNDEASNEVPAVNVEGDNVEVNN
ncbi:alkaline shock response membrane anchor protein AmaP [Fusobacterium pseudoperiodonticum]|uniref:Alkaline shock response membrane anchor protein AmaP n=1 Tax=Fusobacterium pseudoperiodonticum TaxID=2663009 RepID=A0AAD0ASV9_9FUSO|nr:alkaline shock response membrane anchor protein AmaP [Fusobacterium pseudoperiodonticum]ATV66683.1 alkaline shock response membrane anchor protein AmaP [Fusobacterium pseudoperiodonticum]